MIGHIKGKIIHKDDKYMIVSTGGVGYKIYTTTDTLSESHIDVDIALFTYLAVRETALDLFGFKTLEENAFFEMLLSVSGIGPKGALAVLSLANLDTIKHAIAIGDTGYLNKVSGIGRKTAERIVIDLRNKVTVSDSATNTKESMSIENDAVEVLKSLGYSQNEARDALKQVPNDVESVNARIKQALKILSNK